MSRQKSAGRRQTPAARRRLTAAQSLELVRARLQAYADRGVFRGFSEQRPVRGTHRFRFSWLGTQPLNLTYAPETGMFVFRSVCPGVAARSPILRDLRAFVADRASPRLPDHRRVDRRRATLRCRASRGAVSLELVATRNHHEYGVGKIVNLVHEVFLYLHAYHPEYMWERFDAPQE